MSKLLYFVSTSQLHHGYFNQIPRYFIAKIENLPVTVDDNAIYQFYFSVELIPKIIFILDS